MAVNAGPEGRLLVTTDTTWPLRFSGRQRLVLFVLLGAGRAGRSRLAGCRAQALRVSARSWTRTHGFQRRRNHWFPTRMEAIMMDEAKNGAAGTPAMPVVADRAVFEAELDALRVREKAHTREGDAIAAARRRLPMAEVDAGLALTGPGGPLTLLEAFEGRRQLIAYYFMWHPGQPDRKSVV